ncbi:MAG: hypothetical protein ACTSPQ_22370 [Candidatus Helarchaeota archaeon]
MKRIITMLSILILSFSLINCNTSDNKKKVFKIDENNTRIIDARYWREGTFSYEFGVPLPDKLIYAEVRGECIFLNPPETNLDCGPIRVIVDKNDNIIIFIGNYNYDVYISKDKLMGRCSVVMKNLSGKVIKTFTNGVWSQRGGLLINRSNIVPFLKKSKGDIKIVITDEYSSIYKFNINANGFTIAYNQMKK